jgi:hypothetical protein
MGYNLGFMPWPLLLIHLITKSLKIKEEKYRTSLTKADPFPKLHQKGRVDGGRTQHGEFNLFIDLFGELAEKFDESSASRLVWHKKLNQAQNELLSVKILRISTGLKKISI